MQRIVSLLLLITLLAACSRAPDQPRIAPPTGANPTALPTSSGQAAQDQSTATPSDIVAPNQDSAEPAGDTETAIISFAVWDHERRLYEPLATTFMEEHPNIKVVLVPLDDLTNVTGVDEDYSLLAQLRRIVSGADTAPATVVAPELLSSGLLLDLRPYMDADALFNADDFLPGALEQYSVRGGSWVLPRYLNVRTLNYNKDLFKRAGLPEPKPGWTWSDLLGYAEQIAKKNGKLVETYGFLDNSAGSDPLIGLLKEQGIDLFATPPQQIELDRPEIVNTVKRVRALTESGALFPPMDKAGLLDGLGDPAELIRAGRAAIWTDDFAMTICDGPGCPQPQPASYSFAVGKLPYPSGLAGTFGGADGYIVSAGTAHPAAAWQWIEFLSRQATDAPNDPANPGFNPAGRVPARIAPAEQTGFWQGLDAETAAAYKWAIAHSVPPPDHARDYMVFSALGPALQQIIGQGKDPRKALQQAQKELQSQLAQLPPIPTPTPNRGPLVVATPEPQEAPAGATTIAFSADMYNPTELRKLARVFREGHPEIFVDIRPTTIYTEPPSLQQVARANDCFTWYAPPQTNADLKALLDIQPLFDADASFPQADYAPGLLAPYQHGAGLFGLPYAATFRTLNYNKTAFEAAGISPPSYRWTPDDFLAAAQALTKGEGDRKQFGYIPLGGSLQVQDLLFFVNQFGGRLTSGSGKDARPTFTDPKTIAAIQWYIDLATIHKVMPPLKIAYRRADAGFADTSYEGIRQGRAGMWFNQGLLFVDAVDGSSAQKGDGPTPLPFEERIAALPIGQGGLNSADGSIRGFHISAQTQHAPACWEWLKFLSGDINNLQGAIPARRSVLDSDAFKQHAPPETIRLAETYVAAFRQPSRQSSQDGDPNAFLYSFEQYWLFEAISDAIEGKQSLATGLAEAQTFTTAYMECVAKNPNKPATCATQADPGYQGYMVEDPPVGSDGRAGPSD
jgi:ABC-type glycerol-3-phosphate transport system substrate-binding protein